MSADHSTDPSHARLIAACGANDFETEELLAYNANLFDLGTLDQGLRFPLDDEPFVECWSRWAEEAQEEGTIPALRKYLPQLHFPIVEGISQWPSYRRATLQGADPAGLEEATGLELEDEGSVELELYASAAGRVPVFRLKGRAQFATMVEALGRRNEPSNIPDSMGALMIVGFNNWHRIGELKRKWHELDESEREQATWNEAFAEIRKQPELYQDRFMLLSDGPYSAVPAADLGLKDEEWRAKSFIIRRDHECAHYFTRRLFGSMRNNLLDELIADYAGIVAAEGRYRADWFLRFIGLDNYPDYREGGRLDLYRGDPPLSEGAFKVLHTLVVRAARHLEKVDAEALPKSERSPGLQATVIAALASMRIDELASDEGPELLDRRIAELRTKLSVAC